MQSPPDSEMLKQTATSKDEEQPTHPTTNRSGPLKSNYAVIPVGDLPPANPSISGVCGDEFNESGFRDGFHENIYEDELKGQRGSYKMIYNITRELAQAIQKQTGQEVFFSPEDNKTEWSSPSGAFGAFYIVYCLEDERYYGAKRQSFQLNRSEKPLFPNEVKIHMKLTGMPHIIPLKDYVEVNTLNIGSIAWWRSYQIMDLAALGNLKQLSEYLKEETDTYFKSWAHWHVARALLEALRGMHRKRIYHLDIKPENIVVDERGEVWLIDFGCAQEAKQGMVPYSSAGDKDYYSPQRLRVVKAREGEFSGKKADLWAAALTLLELYTGEQIAEVGKDPLQHTLLQKSYREARKNSDFRESWHFLDLIQVLFEASNNPSSKDLRIGQLLHWQDFNLLNNEKFQRYLSYVKEFVQRVTRETQLGLPSALELPPMHSVSYVSRNTLEQALRDRLTAQHNYTQSTKITVLAGLGGSGKTELATYAVHHYTNQFKYKLWFRDVNDKRKLMEQYKQLVRVLDIADKQTSASEAYSQLVAWLEDNCDRPVLIIYDGIRKYRENEDFLYFPSRGAHVIVTARTSKGWDPREVIKVGFMAQEEGEALLEKFLPRSATYFNPIVHGLATDLGYLPLAILRAAACYCSSGAVSKMGFDLSLFFNKEFCGLIGKLLPPIVTTLFEFQDLVNCSPGTRELLIYSAHLAPKEQSLVFLQKLLDDSISQDSIHPGVEDLQSYGLWKVNAAQGTISVYPLVQKVVLCRFKDDWAKYWTHLAEKFINSYGQLNIFFPQGRLSSPLWSHLNTLGNYYVARRRLNLKPRISSVIVDRLLNLPEDVNQGRASSIEQKNLLSTFGKLTLLVGTIIKNIRTCNQRYLHLSNKYIKAFLNEEDLNQAPLEKALCIVAYAKSLLEEKTINGKIIKLVEKKALPLLKEIYSNDHPALLAEQYQCLARLYEALGDYEKKVQLLEGHILPLFVQAYGARSFIVAVTLSNCAHAYCEMGQPQRSMELLTEAFNIFNTLPRDEAIKLLSLISIGYEVIARGALNNNFDPTKQLEEILKLLQQNFPKNHKDTEYAKAIFLRNLADTYIAQAKYQQALQVLKRLNVILKSPAFYSFPLETYVVTLREHYLSNWGVKTGKFGNKFYDRNLYFVLENLAKAGHLSVVFYIIKYVEFIWQLRLCGDEIKATYLIRCKFLLKNALEVQKNRFGENDKTVLIILIKLVNYCLVLNEKNLALEYMQKVLMNEQVHYGFDAPAVQKTVGQLFSSGGWSILTKTLKVIKNKYGVIHEANLPILKKLVEFYESRGDTKKAVKYLKEILDIQEMMLQNEEAAGLSIAKGVTLKKLALLEESIGNFIRAHQYYLSAIDIFLKNSFFETADELLKCCQNIEERQQRVKKKQKKKKRKNVCRKEPSLNSQRLTESQFTVYTTDLTQLSDLSQSLLCCSAFLAPQSQPLRLLLELNLDNAHLNLNRDNVYNQCKEIIDYDLWRINFEEKTVAIHHLPQDMVLQQISIEKWMELWMKVTHCVIKAPQMLVSQDLHFANEREKRLFMLTHLEALWAAYEKKRHELMPSFLQKLESSNVTKLALLIGKIYLQLDDQRSAKTFFNQILIRSYPLAFSREKALCIMQLAQANAVLNEVTETKELVQNAEGLPLLEKIERNQPVSIATYYFILANVYGKAGNLKEKIKLLEERVLPVFRKERSDDSQEVAIVKRSLAHAYGEQEEYGRQKELLEEILPVIKKHCGETGRAAAVTLGYLANVYGALGNYEKKLCLLRDEVIPVLQQYYVADQYQYTVLQSGDVIKRHYGPEHWRVAIFLRDLADAYINNGQHEIALKILCEQVVPVQESYYAQPKFHPELAITNATLAHAYKKLGYMKQAHDLIKDAVEVLENHEHPQRVRRLIQYADVLKEMQKPAERSRSKKQVRKALKIQQKEYGAYHEKILPIWAKLFELYKHLGENFSARKTLKQQILPFKEQHGWDTQKLVEKLRQLVSLDPDDLEVLAQDPPKKRQAVQTKAIIPVPRANQSQKWWRPIEVKRQQLQSISRLIPVCYVSRPLLEKELSDRLAVEKNDRNRTVITVCVGLGGIGKTKLVAYVAYHCADQFDYKFWFENVHDKNKLMWQYQQLTQALGIVKRGASEEEMLNQFKSWLEKNKRPSLIIYDGVQCSKDQANLDFSLPNAHILVTSRYYAWPKEVTTIKVGSMTEDESIELLDKLLQIEKPDKESKEIIDVDRETKILLAKELENFPHALRQAAAYTRQYLGNYKNCLIELRRNKTQWLNPIVDILFRPQQLSANDLRLLCFSALLAPKMQSLQLLLSLKLEYTFGFTLINLQDLSPQDIYEQCNGLIQNGLWRINFVNKTVSVSPLVQVRMLNILDIDRWQIAWRCIACVFITQCRTLAQDFFLNQKDQNLWILTHLEALWAAYEDKRDQILRLATTIKEKTNMLGTKLAISISDIYSGVLDDPRSAKIYLEKILKRAYTETNSLAIDKALWIIKFAKVSVELSELEGLKELIQSQEVLPVLEKAQKKTQVTKHYSMLADVYEILGEPEKKIDLLEQQVLPILIKEKGENSLAVAQERRALANAYGKRGDYQTKIDLLEQQVLPIMTRSFGETSVETAMILRDLANAYGILGEHSKRSEMLKDKVIPVLQKYYGSGQQFYYIVEREGKFIKEYYSTEHWRIAIFLRDLADAYINQGQYEDAKQILKQVISVQNNYYNYSASHPELAITNAMFAKVEEHLKNRKRKAKESVPDDSSIFFFASKRQKSVSAERELSEHQLQTVAKT